VSDSLDRRSPSEPLCGTSSFYFILFYLSGYSSYKPKTPIDKVPFKGSVTTFEQRWCVLETPIPGPIMPVCFGGFFAAKTANLRAGRAVYTKMVKALERGDNTLEGHFAERSHAAILLPAIPHHMVEAIQEKAVGRFSCVDTIGYCGALRDKPGECIIRNQTK
jgi:hypothetical protein